MLRASARRSKKSCRSSNLDVLLRAASTNSVARPARCSAPALMVSTQRRSRSSRSEVASRSLTARIPVSGVRTSWANTASAVSTIVSACTELRLARGFGAGFFAARFLATRFFSVCLVRVRILRGERDVSAICCPPVPAAPCHGGAR
jgi:hypothetical protein